MELEIGGRRAGVTHAPAVSCHQACKPGSVPREGRWPFILGAPCGASHATNPGGSSESRLAAVSRSHAAPIRSCSRWGLPCRPCYQERGALLPHPFTLTRLRPKAWAGGLLSVALSLGLPPPEVIRHRASMENGLSSPPGYAKQKGGAAIRPADT